MKILSLSVLAGVMATPAVACDLCSIYSASQARGEVGKGFYASVAEQFTHFGTMQMEGVTVPNTANQHMDSSVTQIIAGYNFNERFGVQFNLPVINRSFQRPDGAGGIERGSESGVGDVSVVANFSPYRKEWQNGTFHWNVLGGVKFPTGSSSRIFEEVAELTAPPPPPGAPDSGIHGHDLTLGSGSVDGVVGTGLYASYKRFFMSASTQFAIRTKGDFDYQFANDLMWSGGPGVYLALADKYTIALQLVTSGEAKGQDIFQGAQAEDTAVTSVYLGPQISFTWAEKFSAEVGVDLPISIHNSSLQSVPDYRVRVGLNWRF